MHFSFTIVEAGDPGRTFIYDCTFINPPSGAGTHLPEPGIFDGLNLTDATVSGFRASTEVITGQVFPGGKLVYVISQYLI